MSSEMQDFERKLEAFRSETHEQFIDVRADLKQLTQALRDLIRLDGELKGITGALARIGRQVDDHDTRMRTLETTGAVHTVRVGDGERRLWLLLTVLGTAASGVVVYYSTRVLG